MLAASSAGGCDAASAGSKITTAGRTRGVRSSIPRACRWPRVISAPESVVGTAIARTLVPGVAAQDVSPAAASAFATSTTRPPPSATSRSPFTSPSTIAGQVVDLVGVDVVDRAGRRRDCGAAACARSVVSSM